MIMNIFLISFIITYIIGHSGIIVDISKGIWKLTNKNKEWNYQIIGKPFSCYSCMNFWILTIYCLFNNLTLIESLSIGCLFGGIISVIIDKLIGLIIKIINKL